MEPGLLPEFLQQFLSACFSLGDSGIITNTAGSYASGKVTEKEDIKKTE